MSEGSEYSKEDALDEASKMQELIDSGKENSYPDAAFVVERERKADEVLPAIDALFQMSRSDDYDEESVKEYAHLIEDGLPILGDRIIDKERGQFFSTLPFFNKLARVNKNFWSQEDPLINREVREISEMAEYTLHLAIKEMDPEILRQLDSKNTKDWFELLKLVSSSTYDYSIEEGVKFFRNNKATLQEIGETKGIPEIQVGINDMELFLQSKEFDRALVSAIQEGIQVRNKAYTEVKIKHGEPLFRDVLNKYGLDPDDVLEIWRGSYTDKFGTPAIRRNMERILAIETARPGSAKLLRDTYGIRNFERYPESLLIDQYDEAETQRPYGILLSATHDWNGAFGAWNKIQIWETLHQEIKARYGLRVVEAQGKREVARQLIGLDRKYGQHHKISFAFIAGHGTKQSVTFGGTNNDSHLTTADFVEGRGVQRTGSFFGPKPTVVLVSCETGAAGGIAQEISKTFDAKVIAPNISTELKSIEPVLSEEGIEFKIEYRKEDEKPDEGVERTYISGNRGDR